MPLNLQTETDFTPYLKYNAKAGRFYAKLDGIDGDVEIHNPRIVVDFANIKTGWFYFREGMGPEKVFDPSLDEMAARPEGGKDFKRGFEVNVVGGDPMDHYGGRSLGLREMCSTSKASITAIMKMYAQYEDGIRDNPKKVPFFGLVRVVPVNSMYGTNYEPEFKLLAWVERAKVPQLDEVANKEPSKIAPPYHAQSHGDYEPPIDAAPPPMTDMDDEIPF